MPTDDVIDRWHKLATTRNVAALDTLLDDAVVFHSPVVHTPQLGKAITAAYLTAAMHILFNDTFRYVREVRGDRLATLEFTVDIERIRVNGVDIIAWNAAGRIVEFKVMIRPLKAIQIVHQKMAEALSRQT